jgi:hypothetical protein
MYNHETVETVNLRGPSVSRPPVVSGECKKKIKEDQRIKGTFCFTNSFYLHVFIKTKNQRYSQESMILLQ